LRLTLNFHLRKAGATIRAAKVEERLRGSKWSAQERLAQAESAAAESLKPPIARRFVDATLRKINAKRRLLWPGLFTGPRYELTQRVHTNPKRKRGKSVPIPRLRFGLVSAGE